MGLTSLSIRVVIPKLFQLTAFPLKLLLAHLKQYFLILIILSQINGHDHHDDYDDRPSPSLVAVPVFFLAESIKKGLPLMSYSSFVEKTTTIWRSSSSSSGNGKEISTTDGVICAVCMHEIEGSQKVRVPFNCCHVFHRECLDVWVDQCQATCPLCRSKLFPPLSQNHNLDEFGSEGDPWRRERMIYLFGEDYLFVSH